MLMSITEAATHLNVSSNTIRRRLQVGLLTGGKVGGKWMIDVATNGATPDYPQQEPEPPTLVAWNWNWKAGEGKLTSCTSYSPPIA